MKFIDLVEVKLIAGNGGNGAVSFRREKYVPLGGPNGGNGGDGGSIIFRGNKNKTTLLDFNYKKIYQAGRGENGKGSDRYGKRGEHIVLDVPLGTIVKNTNNKEIICDITEHDKTYIIAEGGKGGKGNSCFVTSTNRAPREFEEGGSGESIDVTLELKLIADVGIVGMPNAGKSTFISVVSAAKPKIADYPFTTLAPNLGVVKNEWGQPYVIADMPGLIEGASDGVGLGFLFLRHISRTRLLVHFIDSSAKEPMVSTYETIRQELQKYSKEVAVKPEIVVSTKIEAKNEDNLNEFREYIKERKIDYFEISSITGAGLSQLLECIGKKVLD